MNSYGFAPLLYLADGIASPMWFAQTVGPKRYSYNDLSTRAVALADGCGCCLPQGILLHCRLRSEVWPCHPETWPVALIFGVFVTMMKRTLAVAFAAMVLATAAPVLAETPDEIFSFANALREDQLFEAAAAQYLKFSRQNPTDRRSPVALDRAAECLTRIDKVPQAITVMETMLATYPNDVDRCRVSVQLGRLYAKDRRFSEADQIFTRVVVAMSDCPNVPDAMLGKGEAMIANGNFEGAVEVLRPILDEHIEHAAAPRAAYQTAFAYRKLGRDEQALNRYQYVVAQFPRDPMAGFAALEAGRMLSDRGMVDKALEFYRAAKTFDASPFVVPASKEGAELLEKNDRAGEAVMWYEELLSRPDVGDTREIFIRAVGAASTARDYVGVGRIAAEYDRHYPNTFSPQITLAVARANLARDNYDAVLADVDKLESFAPGTPFARQAPKVRGEALLGLGRPREAIGELRRFVSIGADSTLRCETLNTISQVNFTALGDTSAALRALDELLDVQRREIPSEMLRVGRVYERARQYADAGRIYRDLIDRSPLSDEAEAAEKRVAFINEFTVTDYQSALRAVDKASLNAAKSQGIGPMLELVNTRIDVLKDFDGAGDLVDQLKKQTKGHAGHDRVLYFEGLVHAKQARKALFLDDEQRARDGQKQADKVWTSLIKEQPQSEWSQTAQFQRVLLAGDLAGRVDTTAAKQVLNAYPQHELAVELYERVGEVLLSAGTEPHARRAQIYFDNARRLSDDPGDQRRLQLRNAQAIMAAGDTKKAASEFRSIADRDNSRVGLRAAYEAGVALRELKKYDDAVPYFRRVAARDPYGDFGLRGELQAADCLYLDRRYEGALAGYNAAGRMAKSDARRWQVQHRVAACYQQMGRSEEALQLYQACIASAEGGDARRRVYVAAAALAERLGRTDAQRNYLERLVGEYDGGPDMVAGGKQLSRIYLEAGELSDAEAMARLMMQVAPTEDPEPEALLAMALYRRGEFREARNITERVYAKAGNPSELAYEINVEAAKYYFDNQEFKRSIEILTQFAENCDGEGACEHARYYYAMALFGDNQFDRGTQVATRFFREYPLSPRSPLLHLRMGNALVQSERVSESLIHYEDAANTAQDSLVAFTAMKNLGVTYQRLKQWRDAEQTWQRLLTRFPRHEFAPEASLNVARCKMERGDYSGAIVAYEESMPYLQGEAKARAYYWKGTSYERLGDFQSAVVEYLKVPYLHPGEGLWVVTAELKAAECYARINRGDAAKEIYQKVLRSHGANSRWGKVAQQGIDTIDGKPVTPENTPEQSAQEETGEGQ